MVHEYLNCAIVCEYACWSHLSGLLVWLRIGGLLADERSGSRASQASGTSTESNIGLCHTPLHGWREKF